MTSATALQWGLLLGYLALSIVALVSLRRVESRPMAAAVLFLAAPHIVYYGLFLVWPDVLDAAQTMQFSIALALSNDVHRCGGARDENNR
jgi:hypothetical protein